MVARKPGGQAWQRLRVLVFQRYGTRCHVCACPDAPSDQIDHVIPQQRRPDLAWVVSNLRPIHGRKCPVCGVGCNAWKRDRQGDVIGGFINGGAIKVRGTPAAPRRPAAVQMALPLVPGADERCCTASGSGLCSVCSLPYGRGMTIWASGYGRDLTVRHADCNGHGRALSKAS